MILLASLFPLKVFIFFVHRSNSGPCPWEAGGGTAELNLWPPLQSFEVDRYRYRYIYLKTAGGGGARL